MGQKRDEKGKYRTEYTAEDVLDVFESMSVPAVTTPEVADAVGCSKGTARNRLDELVEEGRLYRKSAGSRAAVYMRLEAEGGRLSGYGKWKQSLWAE